MSLLLLNVAMSAMAVMAMSEVVTSTVITNTITIITAFIPRFARSLDGLEGVLHGACLCVDRLVAGNGRRGARDISLCRGRCLAHDAELVRVDAEEEAGAEVLAKAEGEVCCDVALIGLSGVGEAAEKDIEAVEVLKDFYERAERQRLTEEQRNHLCRVVCHPEQLYAEPDQPRGVGVGQQADLLDHLEVRREPCEARCQAP